jgi:hypothetical protein
VDAPSFGRGAHAWIGRLPHMPPSCAGGINLEDVAKVGAGQVMQEHPLGSGRAADVAEADE